MRSPIAALAVALAFAACKESAPPPPPPAPVAPPPVVKPAVVEAVSASVSGKSDADCVAPFTTEGDATEVKVGKLTFKKTGSVLTQTGGKATHSIVFGTLANIKEPTAENLFNIKRYVEFFAAQKADAILVAGDTGETKEEIAGGLEAVAKSGLPVFAIPGNREGRADFHEAINDLAKKYPNIVDMSRIRLVKLDDASIFSLPGYYDKRFMHSGEAGCLYVKEDVDHLDPIVQAGAAPLVMLSHAEPHGESHEAIDAFQDGNAGDANITAFLKTHKVQFGVFANIQEAGGRGMDLASNLIKPEVPSDWLYLNPGLADSTEWPLNDGTSSDGMVATLSIKDGKGSYSVYRAKKLTEAEEAAAKKAMPESAAEAP